MSTWNVELRERKRVIKIKKILQRWSEDPDGFPGMKILDKRGRKHTLYYFDFSCTREEWEKIREGSKIEITFKESVINPRVIPLNG